MNGQGTYTFGGSTRLTGIKYVGEFRDDKYHGQGTYTYANGDKYVGEFRDMQANGQGTYTYADGRVQEGIWKNNKFIYANKVTPAGEQSTSSSSSLPKCTGWSGIWNKCHGTHTYPNGDKYVGEYRIGNRWNGKMYYSYGDLKGYFMNGLYNAI